MNEDAFMHVSGFKIFSGVTLETQRAVFNFRGKLCTFLIFKKKLAHGKKKLHTKILYYIVYVMTTQCDKIVRYQHQKNAFKVCEIQGTEQFRYAKELLAGEKVCFDRYFFYGRTASTLY